MFIDDREIRDKIAASLELIPFDDFYDPFPFGVVLPQNISKIAQDFDAAKGIANALSNGLGCSPYDLSLFDAMSPYIASGHAC